MKQFTYTITDALGIHARPAGQLAKLAKTFPDTAATITKGERTVKGHRIIEEFCVTGREDPRELLQKL